MKIPIKINEREKKVLLVGGIITLFIIAYYVFSWYNDSKSSLNDYIDAKRMVLEKQAHKISEKEAIKARLKVVDADLRFLNKGVFRGDKPPVVAARIQSILKEMASSINIEITLEKALSPVDRGLYLGIPVEIGFNAPTVKLKKLLYKIKISRNILTVSEMKIHVKNIRKPIDAYTTLIVTGFIKKPEPQDKPMKEDEHAS
jgi:hypothetical protein